MGGTPSTPVGGSGIAKKGVLGKGSGPKLAAWQAAENGLKLAFEIKGP